MRVRLFSTLGASVSSPFSGRAYAARDDYLPEPSATVKHSASDSAEALRLNHELISARHAGCAPISSRACSVSVLPGSARGQVDAPDG